MIVGYWRPWGEWTEEEREFVAAMIGTGFDAAGCAPERRLREAVGWAMSHGTDWGSGVKVFETAEGTFIGRDRDARWFTGLGRLKAFDAMREENLHR